MLSLDHQVRTDLSGRVGRGPTPLRLTAVQVAGADLAGKVSGARLWASYDGGRTWRGLALHRSGSGSWTTSVPESASGSGTVTLKAQAWDTRGNTTTQVVHDAYRLRSRRPSAP